MTKTLAERMQEVAHDLDAEEDARQQCALQAVMGTGELENLVDVLRRGEMTPDLQWLLAQRMDPELQDGLDKFVRRSPGRGRGSQLTFRRFIQVMKRRRIGREIMAAKQADPEVKLESLLEDVMQKYGVSRQTARRAYEEHTKV